MILLASFFFQLVISIWLNIGAMKLQYYEEMIRYSSVRVTEVVRTGTGIEEDNYNNEHESADVNEENDVVSNGDTSCLSRSPPSLTSHEWKVLQILITWMVILSTTSLIPTIDGADRKFVIGVAVNLNLIFFYAAPLSSVVTILRSKSSASIHQRTMIMMSLNAFFWCVYSLAIRDYYILLPNGIGLVLGMIQMMLCVLYPTGGDDDDTLHITNLTEVV
jgi:solute carrier family 50 protein (sugar transporter)